MCVCVYVKSSGSNGEGEDSEMEVNSVKGSRALCERAVARKNCRLLPVQ